MDATNGLHWNIFLKFYLAVYIQKGSFIFLLMAAIKEYVASLVNPELVEALKKERASELILHFRSFFPCPQEWVAETQICTVCRDETKPRSTVATVLIPTGPQGPILGLGATATQIINHIILGVWLCRSGGGGPLCPRCFVGYDPN